MFMYSLVIVCLFAAPYGGQKEDKSVVNQDTAATVESQLVSDERFFSKPISLPAGKVTNAQRERLAKELEAAVDKAKIRFEVIAIRAEAPERNVIALYARGGMTRADCESLARSEVIQRATGAGFRTLACDDKSTPLLFTTPIKDIRGELLIVPVKSDREKVGLKGPVSGVRIESTYLRREGGKWVESERRLWEESAYDRAGSLIRTKKNPVYGDPKTCDYKYRYDRKGRETERYCPDGTGERVLERYGYEEDRYGNWTKKVASVPDGETFRPQWIVYREISYFN